MDAFLIEAELLLDWYLPRLTAPCRRPAREPTSMLLWRRALQPAIDAKPTWVLRDFHSPNLIWLPERSGIACLGILDFQDALIGPAAYDLASLLQDARVDVPEATRARADGPLCARTRAPPMPDFDLPQFAKIYVTLAAQRASKISGHLRAARQARRQAAISASHAARMGLSATLARPSGARVAQRLVQRPCAAVKDNLARQSEAARQTWPTPTPQPRSLRAAPWCWRPGSARACGRSPASAEAAGAGRRQGADRLRARPAGAGRRRPRVVNVHYFADQIERHRRRARNAPQIVISDERANCSAPAAACVKALPSLGERAVLPAQFRHHLDRRRAAQPRALLAAAFDPRAHGRAAAAGADRAEHRLCRPRRFLDGRRRTAHRRGERDVVPFVYAGAAILSPEFFAGAPAGPSSMSPLFDRAIEAGRLYGLRLEGVWMHVGTPEAVAGRRGGDPRERGVSPAMRLRGHFRDREPLQRTAL